MDTIENMMRGRMSDAPAILAPGQQPLTYRTLFDHVCSTVRALNGASIAAGDRVAVVLPNGPEMAVAFLAVSSTSTCAPLNPGYRAEEFQFYLEDLKAKAVIVARGFNSPVRRIAQARGIAVFEMDGFALSTGTPTASEAAFSSQSDTALILHTSGTTSRPKMVPLTQANLLASAANIAAALQLGPTDRCLNVMPLFHIHGLVGALLSSICAGASVVATPGFQAPRFLSWLQEFAPTWYTAVPTMHQAILDRAGEHLESSLRFIRSSSSALAPQVMEKLERVFGVPVIESYGMTEASHQMASNPLPPAIRKPGSVGLSAGPEIAIHDGEVVIRGENVTGGYENNPEANRDAFRDGWFRTGDQGYLDPDGYLFLTGRLKEIINRGGEKVSPREIDEVLLDHPSVAQAVAFAIPDERLGEEIGAAVVARRDVTDVELREFVAARLADFKVPRKLVIVDEIPKGPTGKLQRIGLAEKLGITSVEETTVASHAEPRNETERMLCALWQDVLGVERVGINDNFFQTGGDSILATQFLARLRRATGAELSFVRFFDQPTVAAVASGLNSPDGTAAAPSITTLPRTDVIPASAAQKRIWFLENVGQDPAIQNRPTKFRLRGALDVEALRRSMEAILDRHEVLRTTFNSVDGELRLHVSPPGRFELPLSAPVDEMEEIRRPFDLTRDRMLRAKLIRHGDEDHTLLVTMHHIASDGWSSNVFLAELAEYYRAFSEDCMPQIEELPVQYADFAAWQNSCDFEEQIEYWKRTLAGAPPVLGLPTDHPRPARRTYAGAMERIVLPEAVAEGLRSLGKQESATLFMVLLAGFHALLSRYTGSDDIVVGSPVANRQRIETENLIGPILNTLALRTDLSHEPSFRELLQRVKTVTLGALDHQDVPFDRVVDALKPERSLSHSPVYQVMFQLRNLPTDEISLGDVSVELEELDAGVSEFELNLEVVAKRGELHCQATYNTDLFNAGTVQRLLGHYRTLLLGAIDDPALSIAQLPLLTDGERQRIVVDWNATDKPRPPVCAHALFEEITARDPNRTAIEFEDQQISYGELNARANRIAHRLRRLGVGPENLVGISLERSPDLIAGMLGIMKAGGAYVPLDPDYPKARLDFVMADAEPVALVDPRFLETAGLDQEPDDNPPTTTGPENAAYVIYTSGSTGKPKGAVVLHHGLTNCILSWIEVYGLTAEDRVLQMTPVSFDLSITEIFAPLAVGACLVMARPGGQKDPDYLVDLMDRERVTSLQCVPSLLRLFVERDDLSRCSALRHVMSGGAPLRREDAERLFEHLPNLELVNRYGPTEATVYSTAITYRAPFHAVNVTIGRPIPNVRVYVLDRHLQPVPIGVPGELSIGGAGVARGYWRRPELTAERFPPDPFRPGERIYRTGDLARFLPDGEIEFLGRLDHQVKVRGFRIELGEVEAALLDHERVHEALATTREVGGENVLVAYYTGAAGTDELRSHVGRLLPPQMVPGHIVKLEMFPLLPNGKTDHGSLPVPGQDRHDKTPSGKTEQKIQEIVCRALDLSSIEQDANFFASGGDSISAVRVMSRVNAALGTRLSIGDLFEHPTIAGLAKAAGGVGAESARRGIPRRGSSDPCPLSDTQRRIWFLDQLEPNSPKYNLSRTYHWKGPMDPAALECSLNALVERHEALRTTFHSVAGKPVQAPQPARPIDFSVEETDEASVREFLAAQIARPFDLSRDVLMRAGLARVAPNDHFLILVIHHIAVDVWAMDVLLHELGTLYRADVDARKLALPELPIQFTDYAVWRLQESDAGLAYWRKQLAGRPPRARLPADRKPERAGDFTGAKAERTIPLSIADPVRVMSRRAGVTTFTTLLAAFNVLLCRLGGSDDISLGTPVAGRDMPECESLVGLLSNTVVLRTDLSDNLTFLQLLAREMKVVQDAIAHRSTPFDTLVEALAPERDPEHTPLFDVMIEHNTVDRSALEVAGVELEILEVPNPLARVALVLHVNERDDGVHLRMVYRTALFSAARMCRLLEQYEQLLERLLEYPDVPISALPVDGAARLPDSIWNSTDRDYPRDRCVHELFEQQAERTPNQAALVYKERSLTFAELNRRANQLAHHLISLGVETDALIGLSMDRSLEMVVGILGILKAGVAYVPLDPKHPARRLDFMIRDAELKLLVSDRDMDTEACRVIRLDDAPLDSESAENVTGRAKPENLAYVIYTSGTTGNPKGVEIEHGSVVNYITGVAATLKLADLDGFALVQPLTVDASVTTIFTPLLFGGCLHVIPEPTALDAAALGAYFDQHRIDYLKIAPSHLAALHSTGNGRVMPRRKLIVGGEASRGDWAAELQKAFPECDIYNHYGPTETTVGVTAFAVRECADQEMNGSLPIGRPLPNTKAYVLNDRLQPVPVGEIGELCIAGRPVARGYRRRPELTVRSFVTNPFADGEEERLYRTGDRARYRPDGVLEFLGRSDAQVKVRGFRVELESVETALARHPHVENAAVAVRTAENGDVRLIAHLVAKPGAAVDEGHLRRFVTERLPAHEVPSQFVFHPSLPRTPHGKLDRSALESRAVAPATTSGQKPLAPRDVLETRLVRIWERLLGVRPIGVRDSFFERGGHSLLAVALFAEIEKELGKRLPLATLFEMPTVERLARALRDEGWSPSWSALTPIQSAGARPPLFLLHSLGGNVLFYRELAERMGPEHPVYGLQTVGLDGRSRPLTSVDEMASLYLEEIRGVQPEGPYHLGGYCFGAYIALEIAHRLESQGEEVALLAAINTDGEWRVTKSAAEALTYHARRLASRDIGGKMRYFTKRIDYRRRRIAEQLTGTLGERRVAAGRSIPARWLPTYIREMNQRASRAYRPSRIKGTVIYFQGEDDYSDPRRFWGQVSAAGVEIYSVPGKGEDVLRSPNVDELAMKLKRLLACG